MSTRSILGRATLFSRQAAPQVGREWFPRPGKLAVTAAAIGGLLFGLAVSRAMADEEEGYSQSRVAVANHAAWMSFIPDDTSLTELSIPGSHDSATFGCHGIAYTSCACQSMD